MKKVLLMATSVIVAACANSTGPGPDGLAGGPNDRGQVRVLGAIAGYNQGDPQIELSVSGRTVAVAVTSYGDGCYRKGETEVQVDGLRADVTPWDYGAPPGTPCTQPLLSGRHTANITFDRAGTAVIRFHGIDRSRASAQNPNGERITVERRVEIR